MKNQQTAKAPQVNQGEVIQVNKVLNLQGLFLLKGHKFDEPTDAYPYAASPVRLLNNNSQVTELNAKGFMMGDIEYVNELAKAIAKHPSLEKVNFSSAHLRKDAMLTTINAIKQNGKIKHINLANNFMDNEVGEAIISLLSENSSVIESLNIENNIEEGETLIQIIEDEETSENAANTSDKNIPANSINQSVYEDIIKAALQCPNLELLVVDNDSKRADSFAADESPMLCTSRAAAESMGEANNPKIITDLETFYKDLGKCLYHQMQEVNGVSIKEGIIDAIDKTNLKMELIYLNKEFEEVEDCLETRDSFIDMLEKIYLEPDVEIINNYELKHASIGITVFIMKNSTLLTNIYRGHSDKPGEDAEAVNTIAEALKINKSVTSVQIENNNIGDEGAIALAESLKVNKSVTNICLWNNDIGEEGAKALVEALKINTSITEIDLISENIGKAEVNVRNKIEQYIERNKKIAQEKANADAAENAESCGVPEGAVEASVELQDPLGASKDTSSPQGDNDEESLIGDVLSYADNDAL